MSGKPQPVVLTLSMHDREYSVKLPWDADANTVVDGFAGLMICHSYPKQTVKNALEEYAAKNHNTLNSD